MKAQAVIGANFGDEGKGAVVDWLASTRETGGVVRFNGGAQAGHTVVTPDGKRHEFHHFGAGSFLGIPTFLSQHFVCNPTLFFKELDQLIAFGLSPQVYAHPDCKITTITDMIVNQEAETLLGSARHGSCGVGVHETMLRDKNMDLRLRMNDLWQFPGSLPGIVETIDHEWFEERYIKPRLTAQKPVWVPPRQEREGLRRQFIHDCGAFANLVKPATIKDFKNPIFEGAQGLLLDEDNQEFFPHVTHSKTGLHNVGELCIEAGINELEAYYVSRTYVTRHGAGPLPGENKAIRYTDKTNVPNKYQGQLRFAPLHYHSLMQRCHAETKKIAPDSISITSSLILTHCDQCPAPGKAHFYSHGETREHFTTQPK